jgi:hypothetical protein
VRHQLTQHERPRRLDDRALFGRQLKIQRLTP